VDLVNYLGSNAAVICSVLATEIPNVTESQFSLSMQDTHIICNCDRFNVWLFHLLLLQHSSEVST
jgi:hypothetical protein